MALVKVSELEGAALDWAVAECEVEAGNLISTFVSGRGSVKAPGYCHEKKSGRRFFYILSYVHQYWIKRCEGYPFVAGTSIWSPSFDWSQGGPIKSANRISSLSYFDSFYEKDRWFSTFGAAGAHPQRGDTELQAAMRCYVASKLGESIEIPEELT